MGGRGSSSNIGKKPYGTEFKSVLKVSNIKFLRQNGESKNAKEPLETKTKGRIYVNLNEKDEINSITYYDTKGMKVKSINLLHDHGDLKGGHAHMGYYHDEQGTRKLTSQEKEMVEYVKKIWYSKRGK